MKKGHLLLIDDEASLLSVLSFMLEPYAEKISAVETGTEALKIIDSEGINCIICDLNLPRMSGLEILKHIKERNLNIPFFFFTAVNSEAMILQAIRLGARDYFFKPQFLGIENAVNCALNSLPYRPDPDSEFSRLSGSGPQPL